MTTITDTSDPQPYIEDEATGDSFRLMLGDSCERLAEIDDNSVDLSVYSPPFASLFTYSPSDRDLGNSSSRSEFVEHYSFILSEILRVTKTGRNSCVHVQQVTTSRAVHGEIGITDFRGDVIAAHIAAGWVFYGEVTVNKDPQAQAIRTKAHCLMFQTLDRDSASNRPALADYLLVFKKPGDNEVQIKPVENGDITRNEWIEWAQPIWWNIRESDTLQYQTAREDADERHICPLQLPFIDRCVRLWSNPGELVLSPFAGIGSEGHQAILRGRRFIGCELKPSYWASAVKNLHKAEYTASLPSLFDDAS
jgi:DNA modification methylase